MSEAIDRLGTERGLGAAVIGANKRLPGPYFLCIPKKAHRLYLALYSPGSRTREGASPIFLIEGAH